MSSDPIERFSIHLVRLDPVEGSEMDKSRPCVVVSPDELNRQMETVIVAPMTTTRIRLPTRIPWRFNGQKCDIVLHQLRTVDRTRLSQRIGVLEPTIARQVLAALQQLFASPAEPESPPAG